jgi:formate-dependent nitrite reductase membrane component NrfD
MTSPSPTVLQAILLSMTIAFVLALLFIPPFAVAIADVLHRHANAVAEAYRAYQRSWNQESNG